MSEYIERDKLTADFELCNKQNPRWTPQRVASLIARANAADVVEVVHGEWRTAYTDKENKTTGVECSECGAFYNLPLFDFGLMYNYCPNCGARMDGDV